MTTVFLFSPFLFSILHSFFLSFFQLTGCHNCVVVWLPISRTFVPTVIGGSGVKRSERIIGLLLRWHFSVSQSVRQLQNFVATLCFAWRVHSLGHLMRVSSLQCYPFYCSINTHTLWWWSRIFRHLIWKLPLLLLSTRYAALASLVLGQMSSLGKSLFVLAFMYYSHFLLESPLSAAVTDTRLSRKCL